VGVKWTVYSKARRRGGKSNLPKRVPKDKLSGGETAKAVAHVGLLSESSGSVRVGGAEDASSVKGPSTIDHGSRVSTSMPASSISSNGSTILSSSGNDSSNSTMDQDASAVARLGGVGLGGGSSLGSRGLNLDSAPLLSPNAGQRPRTPRPGDSAPKAPNPRGNFDGLRGLMMVDINEVWDWVMSPRALL
jgi:hypothetical protein